jgi:hypothetical protein
MERPAFLVDKAVHRRRWPLRREQNANDWQVSATSRTGTVPFDLLCTGDVTNFEFMFIHMPTRQSWACKALSPEDQP